MKKNIEQDTIHTLDQQVRTMRRLLTQLDPEVRLEYIKEMLPVLLNYGQHNAKSVQQKLKEHQQSPIQSLTSHERELINDLGKKTENLYKAMNDEDFSK